MSNESWLKEFYPIDAGDVPASKAIKHSLIKWYGLRKESLEKHGITEPPIDVTDNSCALCMNYQDGSDCSECPLENFLSRPCASYLEKWEYEKYTEHGDPEPMIAALEAIKFVERTCK